MECVPSLPALEALPIARQIADNAYGGMPVQLGYCNSHNTRLNCLEYRRDSEEARKGAVIALTRENIDIAADI